MEIATNVKLNPLYIVDRQDEIEFVHRAATVIKSILNRDDLKLKESNNHRECNIFLNEIDTLESVLGRLSDLKLGDKEFWKKYRAC